MKCTCIDGWRRCAVCYGTGALCAICGDPVDEGGSCGKCPIAATRSSSSSAGSSSGALWALLEDTGLFAPDHQERALVWDGPCGSIRLCFGPLGDLLRIEEDEDREETAASLLAAVAATVGAEDWRDVGWMVRELAQRGAIGRLAPLPRKLPCGKRAPRVVSSSALRAAVALLANSNAPRRARRLFARVLRSGLSRQDPRGLYGLARWASRAPGCGLEDLPARLRAERSV